MGWLGSILKLAFPGGELYKPVVVAQISPIGECLHAIQLAGRNRSRRDHCPAACLADDAAQQEVRANQETTIRAALSDIECKLPPALRNRVRTNDRY